MYDWSKGGKSKFVKISVGEEKVLKVFSLKEKPSDNPTYNLKGMDYYLSVDTDQGELKVNTWGLYFACQGVQLREGKTYSIKYIKKGGLGKGTSQYEIFEINPEARFEGTKVSEEAPF